MAKYRFIYSDGTDGHLDYANDDEAIHHGIKFCRLFDSSYVYVWKKLCKANMYSFVGKFER